MESKSERAPVVKKLLWDTYRQKIMSAATASTAKLSPFETAVGATFEKASTVMAQGLSTETLTMARTRFVLDWFKQYGERYPFRLFDHHQQLLKAGLFEAYDRWLFGESENKARFTEWKTNNVDDFLKLENFLFNRVFKLSRYPYPF
jgi:hypothetical protein